MANKPPKHPSAANMGMCVRTYNDGVYHDIDPALSAGGGCGWLVVCGISVGVSCVNRDFYRFQTRPWCQGLHILTTEKRRCGSRQRVAASELDVGTVGELSGVADLLVDVETSQIPPHADARQSFRASPGRIPPLASCAAPRRAKKIWKSWRWTSSRRRRARHPGRSWHRAGRASPSLL